MDSGVIGRVLLMSLALLLLLLLRASELLSEDVEGFTIPTGSLCVWEQTRKGGQGGGEDSMLKTEPGEKGDGISWDSGTGALRTRSSGVIGGFDLDTKL